MGNTCNHPRSRVISEDQVSKGILTNKKIIVYECLDCMTGDKPTQFRKEVKIGNLTGITYSQSDVDKRTCKHEHFDVDESTISNHSEKTLATTMIGMMTARWFEPVRTFSTAHATCKRCDAKFWVESDYNRETKWQDYKKTCHEVHGEWKIRHQNKAKETTVTEVMYIDK